MPKPPRDALRAPLVSVVVSHFDRKMWLIEALDSIAQQSFADFEIIVVNDAGPDAAELVLGWGRGHPFATRYVHRAVNGGVAAARNTGVRAARGALIAYLDDADLWYRDLLGGLVGLLQARPECGLAYGDADVIRVAPLLPAFPPPADPRKWKVNAGLRLAVPFRLDDLKRDDFIVPGGMLHRHSLYEAVGPFDESLFVSEDWDWLLRAAMVTTIERLACPVIVVRIRDDGSNLSADQGAGRRAALDAIEQRHGTARLEPKTFWEVAKTYARRD